ncbi:MFS general substrate transporter [Microthyrium microscopicum]|uniref:MFS general substrate transporter n=1 Tax=Microthyrium microscopicum TaxID=703497 RepID=A0A6A6U1V8_9PEZI|nr:MFS general substrate transporter [Microthyrium microscopicum]
MSWERRERRLFAWRNPFTSVQHLQNVAQKRVLDSYSFDWQVFAVAASGFFTDSYNLFATNVILPALAYVYWPTATSTDREATINLVTLASATVGQLLFGYLADRYGRQKLYGVELILVTVSTLGLAQCSYGVLKYDGTTSMSILGWILFFRTIMGCGIGAEYPLSAGISAEWSSSRSRARMLAAVFLMQPLGQLAAYVVGTIVLVILNRHYQLDTLMDSKDAAPIIDVFWRWVTGIGALPALIALGFRLSIPESGRWRLDVQGQADRAILETHAHFGTMTSLSLDDDLELRDNSSDINVEHEAFGHSPQQISGSYLARYLFTDGNWRYLAGTSLCWFIVDFVYYGLQINNPRFLAKLWNSHLPNTRVTTTPAWLPNPLYWDPTTSQPTVTIYHVLMENSRHAMISVSIAAVLGSLLLIQIIDYVSRRKFLIWSFLGLAVLTAAMGVSYLYTFGTSHYWITLTLFVLCQFFFNLGPNTLTFIIPAEIFPTPIRCTCHGISAAAGKLSSVIVQSMLIRLQFGNHSLRDLDSNGMGWMLIIFSTVLLLGAFCAWLWIPEVQSNTRLEGSWILPSKSLEELAVGKTRTEREAINGLDGLRRRFRAATSPN